MPVRGANRRLSQVACTRVIAAAAGSAGRRPAQAGSPDPGVTTGGGCMPVDVATPPTRRRGVAGVVGIGAPGGNPAAAASAARAARRRSASTSATSRTCGLAAAASCPAPSAVTGALPRSRNDRLDRGPGSDRDFERKFFGFVAERQPDAVRAHLGDDEAVDLLALRNAPRLAAVGLAQERGGLAVDHQRALQRELAALHPRLRGLRDGGRRRPSRRIEERALDDVAAAVRRRGAAGTPEASRASAPAARPSIRAAAPGRTRGPSPSATG